jgi:hypothetical protein
VALPPADEPIASLLDGGLATTATGLVRWDGTWTRVADDPDPANPGVYQASSDGAVWRFTLRPARARPLGPDGWEPEEVVTVDVDTVFAAEDHDIVWVGTAGGTVGRRTAAGWHEARAVDTRYLVTAAPDRQGGIWLGTADGGPLVHLRGDGAIARVEVPDLGDHAAAAVPGDNGDLAYAFTRRGLLTAYDWIPASGGLHRAFAGDRVVWSDRSRPTPCALTSAALDRDGKPWIRCAHGEVLVLGQETGGPALAAAPWPHGDVAGEGGGVAIDLDVDGDDDLLTWGSDGRPSAFFQEHGELVRGDVPRGIPAGLRVSTACDLDGDGRTDLAAWASGWLGVDNGYVLLRHRQGWFDDIAQAAGAPARPVGPMEDVFPPVCADLDDDGDLDVAVPMGGDRHLGGRSVVVFENEGLGRFTFVDDERWTSTEEWVSGVLVADFDGDGASEQLHLAPWRGAFVRAAGRPIRWGVGPWGGYPEKLRGWAEDLDRDGDDDAIVVDSQHGPRIWRGDPTFALADATDAYGLGALADRAATAAAFVDVDGDRRRDLLGCDDRGCWVATRTGENFQVSDWPLATGRIDAIVPFDLHADGDLDLLIARDGDEALLENRGGGTPVVRTQRWSRVFAAAIARSPLEHLTLAALAIGPWVRFPIVAALAVGAFFAAIDLPVPTRVVLAALSGAAGAGVWAAWQARDRARSRPRIDRYVLDEVLGTGGLGTVYGARDPATGEPVAIKVLRPGLFSSDIERELFEREVAHGSEVRDPRLVRLLRWGEVTVATPAGRLRTAWIAMERLPGGTLRARLQTGPIGAGPACAVGEALCAGLAALHASGIVHGDVKPENIVLVGGGQLRLTDFGAARAVAASGGIVLATPGYSPPERGPADVRGDVFAVGVVTREAAGDVDPALAAVLRRASDPDPSARYPSVTALRAELVRWATAIPDPEARGAVRRAAPTVAATGFAPTGDGA